MNTTSKRTMPTVEATGEKTPVEQMSLPELALEFGKQCLGWKDAKIEETHPDKKLSHFDKTKGWIALDYHRLQSVMPAVRDWLSAKDAYKVEEKFEELFNFSFGSYFVGAVDEAEICHELLAACVEARRRGM
jgi:hypothetical protein